MSPLNKPCGCCWNPAQVREKTDEIQPSYQRHDCPEISFATVAGTRISHHQHPHVRRLRRFGAGKQRLPANRHSQHARRDRDARCAGYASSRQPRPSRHALDEQHCADDRERWHPIGPACRRSHPHHAGGCAVYRPDSGRNRGAYRPATH